MSCVYIVEFFFADKSRKKILKIGSSNNLVERINKINRSIETSGRGCQLHIEIPCSPIVRFDLEKFLIKNFISRTGIEPFKGREWFYIAERDDIYSFIKDVNNLVVDFFDMNKKDSGLPESIGSLIKSKRTQRGMTQDELALKAGLRQATISDIEKGNIGNFKTLQLVLETLGLSLIILDGEKIS